VVEIGFDEAFDEDTFVFTPPAGEAVRSVVDLLPIRHDLTIDQAVALAPFTVWIPARLSAQWEAQIGFAAEQDRPPMAPQVHLHYRAPDGTHGLSVAESPADHPGEHGDYGHARAHPWRTSGSSGGNVPVPANARWSKTLPSASLYGDAALET